MKIAIISDIHDNLVNLDIFFKMIKEEGIKNIICCGDVTNRETLEKMANKKFEKIYLVYGNVELYEEEDALKYENIEFLGRFNIINIDDLKIGLCHEPGFFKNVFQMDKEVDYIFYGHTHKPWMSVRNKAKLINPGTLGGVFQKPSFAIFDTETKKIKLKLIHL